MGWSGVGRKEPRMAPMCSSSCGDLGTGSVFARGRWCSSRRLPVNYQPGERHRTDSQFPCLPLPAYRAVRNWGCGTLLWWPQWTTTQLCIIQHSTKCIFCSLSLDPHNNPPGKALSVTLFTACETKSTRDSDSCVPVHRTWGFQWRKIGKFHPQCTARVNKIVVERGGEAGRIQSQPLLSEFLFWRLWFLVLNKLLNQLCTLVWWRK